MWFHIKPDASGTSHHLKRIGQCRGFVQQVVTAGRCLRCLGVASVSGVGGEGMSQQLPRAALLPASDTYPSRMQRSLRPIGSRSDRGPRSSGGRESKIIIVLGYAEWLLVAQRISTGSRRRLPNSILSGRFRCKRDRVATDFAVPSVARGRPAEEPILRRGRRCIDHEPAN